jgi:hypothetical protein
MRAALRPGVLLGLAFALCAWSDGTLFPVLFLRLCFCGLCYVILTMCGSLQGEVGRVLELPDQKAQGLLVPIALTC